MHYKKVVESEGEPCAAENWSSYTSFPTLAPMRGDQGWLALPYPVQGGLIRATLSLHGGGAPALPPVSRGVNVKYIELVLLLYFISKTNFSLFPLSAI